MSKEKESLRLKWNHLIYWRYYKRVPEFYRQWCYLKSMELLKQNYEHHKLIIKGNEEVISNAIKRERENILKIANLELRAKGITQEQIDRVQRPFGTDLKGISKAETDN